MMKPSALMIAMSLGAFAAPAAVAQIEDTPLERSGANVGGVSAMAFVRFTLADADRNSEQPTFGLGFYRNASAGFADVDARPGNHFQTRGVGFEFAAPLSLDGPLILSALGPSGRRNMAGWTPQTGVYGLQGDGQPGTGSTDWAWIVLGLAAGVGVVSALTEDDDPLMCTGNTVPDPINGVCVPLNLG